MADISSNEAMYHMQAAALEPLFAVARVGCSVLEVGVGTECWGGSFGTVKPRFVGVDVDQDALNLACANFPEGRFDLLGPNLYFPYEDESFDLVFSVDYMRRNPTHDKKTLVSEMWRVVRSGGVLIFLEDFVFEKQTIKPDIYPLPLSEFFGLIVEATAGQVVLEHVESLQYPHENVHRSGVISFSKLGVC